VTPDQLIARLARPDLDAVASAGSLEYLAAVEALPDVRALILAAQTNLAAQEAVLVAINELVKDRAHERHPRDHQVACLLVVVDRAIPEARSWACSTVWQNRSFDWADRTSYRIAERWIGRPVGPERISPERVPK
jgi:hypothetical protein